MHVMTTAQANAGTAGKTAAERVPSQSGEVATAAGAGRETVLATEHGKTTIADVVVQKIAGLAAREISGVHKLGGGVARAFGVVMERIPGATPSVGQGVSVEVGERQAAVDLDLVVEYGVEIGELTEAIRRNVIGSIERMTGLEVTEVNISVDDVHLPGDDGDGDGEARVE
jgi:uncharacterized alkaline shock family protein YloU